MKIGVKMIIFWVASLALFTGTGVVFLLNPVWLSGIQGPFILFFLGYCAIIVVAQAFALIEILRDVRASRHEKNRRYQAKLEST